MIQHTLETTSLASLLAIVESLPGSHGHLFRGHGDATWGLIPTLYRAKPNIHGNDIEDNYNLFEEQLLHRFFQEGLPYLPSLERGYSNDRSLAQHFGVPTRLLDWSEDPLVATFFAVEHWDWATDAAIFMLLPDARFLPEHVKDTKSYNATAFRPPAIDRRIPAQRSIFTIHPHSPSDKAFIPLDQRLNVGNLVSNPNGKGGSARGFAKITIPRDLKRGIFQRLLRIGIDRRNLFPGLDGVGADTAARAKCGQWM